MQIFEKPIIYKQEVDEAMNLILLQQKQEETYIQQTCKVIFDRIKLQARLEFEMDFMQIDNGGKQTVGGKYRKKAEGTTKGASDVQLLFCHKKSGKSKMVLCEFKRIGTPSQIHIKKEQIDFQERWKKYYGWDGFITNNPLYFEWRVNKILESFA